MKVSIGASSDAIIPPAIAATAMAAECKSQERIGGSVIAGERMTRLQGRTDRQTDGTDADVDGRGRTVGRRTKGQIDGAHAKIIFSSWCSNGCDAAKGAAGGEAEQSWRMREREMPKCRSCRVPRIAAAVIVIWRGKERVDTTQLSLAKRARESERSRWGGSGKLEDGQRTRELQHTSILFCKMAPQRRHSHRTGRAHLVCFRRIILSSCRRWQLKS